MKQIHPLWPISPCARFEGEGEGEGGGAAPVALADHEGQLRENWKEGLDEDIRGEPCLNLIGDNVFEGIKQLVHAQKNVGKNKVTIPGENGTQTDWDAFYNAGGKPATAGDYAYKPPEEGFRMPEEEVKGLQDFFHEIGLSKWQAGKAMQRLHDGGAQVEKDKEAALVTETAETEQKLKDLWGMAYEERVHIANRLINETTEEGDKRADFIKKFGRDPMFIEWASGVGKNLVEHEMLVAELTHTAPKEAQQELLELQASDDYSDFLSGDLKRKNLAKHNRIQAKENELYDIITQVPA